MSMDDPEIIGDWVRERVLGCGGFGIVSLWKNTINYDRIAIKKYRGENDNLTQKQKDRWTQEVLMMKKINNDNIVSFKKLPQNLEDTLNKHNPSRLPMLSMEFCTQGDLRSLLIRSENCCGLPETDVRYILKDLMNAVSYLHTLKITHRDLKPENIVLQTSDRPNGIIYKLIDLGYAKELDAKSICASFVGTLQYLAPELMYSKTYSCSVDYWSMGLVAFEIICGIRPFLPNKSPAQWMFHVHKKNSDIISIHQMDETDESIKCFKEIFQESHISSCFKSHIESWLQLALEYNPRKRGYANYDPDSSNNQLVIFTTLKEILDKKIITVFSVNNCQFLSYEIDDCTRVETVQKWIERDTKITKTEQFLLSHTCDNINLEGLATQFFDEAYSQTMLYVFKKSEILLLDIRPKYIPELVEKMLQDASETIQFYFQKRSYAHALYFIFTENHAYNTVLDACSLKIKHIIKTCDETSHKCRSMNINIEKLVAQKDLSKELLDFDFKQYMKHFSQSADHWVNSLNVITNKIDKLHEGCNHISIRHESAYRRASALSVAFNKEYSKHNDHDLNKLLDEGIDCYSTVRSRSKEKRSKPENCKNMAKILYNVLKSRDKLLRAVNFRKCLQIIVDIDLELEKMSSPLDLAVEHIEKFKNDLISDTITRQTKIWELTIKQKNKPKNTDDLKPHFLLGQPYKSLEDYGTPISLDRPLHFILGDTTKSLESNASFHSTSDSHPNNIASLNTNVPTNDSQLNNTSKSLDEKHNKTVQQMKSLPTEKSLETKQLLSTNNIASPNKNVPTSDCHINNTSQSLGEKHNKTVQQMKSQSTEKSLETKQLQSTNDGQLNNIASPNKNVPTNISQSLNEKNNNINSLNVKQMKSLPTDQLQTNENHNNNVASKKIIIQVPNFAVGEPISELINYNLSLRHELQEKTHESFMNYKSILNEQLDFSFLNE